MSQLISGRPSMFLKLLRRKRLPLTILLRKADADVLALSNWLKNPRFVAELKKIMKRMNQIQALSTALARFNASERLTQEIRSKKTSVEVLRKTCQPTTVRRPRAKPRVVRPSFVHEEVTMEERGTLIATLRSKGE